MRKRKNLNSTTNLNKIIIYSNFLLLYTMQSVNELQDKLTDLENKICDLEEQINAWRIHNFKTDPNQ